MTVHDVPFASYAPAPAAALPALPAQAGGHGESFFSELLDIINPLQHLPVIGTIYRAITGDKVDAFAKVAGDALYGGVWGAATAAADVAFEAITGKSAEDTVLALFDSHDDAAKATRVAANLTAPDAGMVQAGPLPDIAAVQPQAPMAMTASAQLPPEELAAFTAALSSRGVTGDTAQRALYAYQRSVALTGQPYGQPYGQPVTAGLH
jgi:hypothetical protein